MKLTRKRKAIILIASILLIGIIVLCCIIFGEKFESDFKTKRLEKVIATQNDALDKTYENLILPNQIQVVNPKNLYQITTARADTPFSDESMNKFTNLFKTFSGVTLAESDIEMLGNNNVIVNADDYIGTYMESDNIDITTISCANARINNQIGIKEVINVARGDNTNATYDIFGEDYSVDDAIVFAENYLKQIDVNQYLNDGDTLDISKVIVLEVYKTDETLGNMGDFFSTPEELEKIGTTFMYVIQYDIYIDGIPISNSGDMGSDGDYFISSIFEVGINKKGEIGWIHNTGYYDIAEKKEITSEIIPLESCLENVSEYLAAYRKYEVKEVGMRYCYLANIEQNHGVLRPMWRIVLDETMYPQFVSNDFYCLIAYVDVETGEIYMFDDSSGLMLSDKD